MSTPPLVELLDLVEIRGHPYLLVQWTSPSESCRFHWQLDQTTGAALGQVWRREIRDSRKCRLSHRHYYTPGQTYGRLNYVKAGASHDALFRCSDAFASQLKQLHELRDAAPLRALLRAADSPVTTRHLAPGRTLAAGFRRHVSLAAAACLGLAFVLMVTASIQTDLSGYVELSRSGLQAGLDLEAIPSWTISEALIETEPTATTEAMVAAANPCAAAAGPAAGEIVRSVGAGEVALTFDDGPSPYTRQIVNALDAYNAPAVFFFIGLHMEQWSGQAEAAGRHIIGNHSYSHRDFRFLSREEQESEIAATSARIRELTGFEPLLFRPPFGRWNPATARAVEAAEMTMVLWNRDPQDWLAPSADEVVDRFFASDPSGGVFILHETAQTAAALPVILERLAAAGLEVVTLCR